VCFMPRTVLRPPSEETGVSEGGDEQRVYAEDANPDVDVDADVDADSDFDAEGLAKAACSELCEDIEVETSLDMDDSAAFFFEDFFLALTDDAMAATVS
jgi:hypothetical protein